MTFPKELKYTKEHEWIKVEGSEAILGITKFAIDQLGDVVHIELPKIGDSLEIGKSFGTIESTKTVSDLYSPVKGKVSQINSQLSSSPELIAEDPHEKFWICKVTVETVSKELLNSDEYNSYVVEAGSH